MILSAGEVVLLQTYDYAEDRQIAGPFRVTRDLDVSAVLADYLQTLIGLASNEDLIAHSRASMGGIDRSAYSLERSPVEPDFLSEALVAWMVKEGMLECVPARLMTVSVARSRDGSSSMSAELWDRSSGVTPTISAKLDLTPGSTPMPPKPGWGW